MEKCLTVQLLPDASGCLIEKPECSYAKQFGFSFICCHPDHAQFHVHLTGTQTKDEAVKQYKALRQKRRDEFVARLTEESRKFFCYRTDFHGKPLPADPDRA